MTDEALWQACSDGDLDKVDELLKDPNVDCNYQCGDKMDSPIMIALRNDHIQVFNRLIQDKRVDYVNVRNILGSTPYAIACARGNLEAVKFFLSQPNIDFNTTTHSGASLFYFACQNGHAGIVELLLTHPDINVNQSRKSDGCTPLLIASYNQHDFVVKLLITHPNIDANIPDNDRRTPLWMAAQEGLISVVKLLLAMREEHDVMIKPNPGPEPWRSRTAAEQAKAMGHIRIFQLLKSYEPSDDPIETKNRQAKIRKTLRKELKINVEDAAQLLALVVLLSDEYLQFKQENETQSEKDRKAIRYFQFNLKLPLELQTSICNLTFEHDSVIMPSELFEEGLKAALKPF